MKVLLPFGTSPGRTLKVANELYRIESVTHEGSIEGCFTTGEVYLLGREEPLSNRALDYEILRSRGIDPLTAIRYAVAPYLRGKRFPNKVLRLDDRLLPREHATARVQCAAKGVQSPW